ncbi:MAG TPA: TonB-dependent receptor [Terricaulis sp.]|nr:TonB-dependent receptor [Terricaulis sp.]
MSQKMWVSALALSAGFAGAAHAQEAVTETEELVITAQLREQRLIEVPIAVTAYGEEMLSTLGVTKYDELALFVPGFEVQEQSANNPGFVIRGITSDSGEATTEPRVAVYQDGVSTSRSRGSYMELFDVERVEVARGPQATLYGRGALIGAVNVIQNKPDFSSPSLNLEAGGGEDGYGRMMLALNAPLNEMFALRTRDGYVENLAGGEALGAVDVAAARVGVAFRPTNNLRFDLIGNIHTDSNSGTPFKSGTFAPTGSDLSPYTPAALNTFGNFEGGRALGLEREVRAATLLGRWDISPSFTLQSITGWREFEAFETFDPDGSGLPLIVAAEDAQGQQFSQEFRLLWDNGGPLTGFFGVSYFDESGSQRTPTQYDERYAFAFAQGALPGPFTPSSAVFDAAYAPALISGLSSLFGPGAANVYNAFNTAHYEYSENYGETESFELFADATWRVTDRFELTAGVRYTEDEKLSRLTAGASAPSLLGNLLLAQALPSRIAAATLAGDTATAAYLTALAGQVNTGLGTVAMGGGAGALVPVGLFTQPMAAPLEHSGEYDALTWRLIGRYALADNISAWASYARGRRPEVISLAAGNLPGSSPSARFLPAEEVDSYELGLRTQSIAGGTLDLEGSVFYYAYNNFQTTTFDGLALVTVNAGEASAYGFEGAANWRPLSGLHVFATYGYNHARFDGGAREGNKFRLSPDHSASFGLRYEFPISAGAFYVTPTYTWQSKIFFDDDNDRSDLQPSPLPGLADTIVDEYQDAYGLLNVRAGFDHASGRWGLGLFVTNALDEDYLIDAGNTGDSFTIPTFIRGAPRLIGAEVKVRF